MRSRAVVGWLGIVAVLFVASACRHRDAAQVRSDATARVAKLTSPDPGVRRDAAKDLAADDGPPPDAVEPLVVAAERETNPRALQAMLTTLGNSGAPAAKPVLDAHAEDADGDTRRAAQKAVKKWRLKNGQVVRRDVETHPAAEQAAASSPPSADTRASDACGQFKEICAADPFSVDGCKRDLTPLSKSALETWADCVNGSSLTCQKAHEACIGKARSKP